jgi:sterol desaturase/sphingolipid hydroxylase (fatty acid hydroxylase superfamily)
MLTPISSLVTASGGGYVMRDHSIKGFLQNILTNLPMLTTYHVVFHEPPGNQVTSYLLHVTKLPKIFAISTWAVHVAFDLLDYVRHRLWQL